MFVSGFVGGCTFKIIVANSSSMTKGSEITLGCWSALEWVSDLVDELAIVFILDTVFSWTAVAGLTIVSGFFGTGVFVVFVGVGACPGVFVFVNTKLVKYCSCCCKDRSWSCSLLIAASILDFADALTVATCPTSANDEGVSIIFF